MDSSIFEDLDNPRYSKYDRPPEEKPANENVLDATDPDYLPLEDGSSSTARRQEFKLTLCEYESIALRLETSLGQLRQVADVLDSKDNFKALREKVNRDCEQMTLRVEIQSHYKSKPAINGIAVEIFKCKVSDLDRRGFLMVKTQKSRVREFLDAIINGQTYIFDRIRLLVNVKGEVVLTTTSSTVFREESDESDISMELSQKQRDFYVPSRNNRKFLDRNLNIESALQQADKEEEVNRQLPYIA